MEGERDVKCVLGTWKLRGDLREICVLWNLLLGSVKKFGQKVTFLFENIPHLLADNKHYRILVCAYIWKLFECRRFPHAHHLRDPTLRISIQELKYLKKVFLYITEKIFSLNNKNTIPFLSTLHTFTTRSLFHIPTCFNFPTSQFLFSKHKSQNTKLNLKISKHKFNVRSWLKRNKHDPFKQLFIYLIG